MGLGNFSKSERRGLVLLLLLLTAIVVVVLVRHTSSSVDSEDVCNETEPYFREILQQRDSVEAQFDSIAVEQKRSTKEIRRKKGMRKKAVQKTYPTRDFHDQPIPTEHK